MSAANAIADFQGKLLRMKECLGLPEDQQVAAALGLTRAAFSERKRRGAFPDERLAFTGLRYSELDAHYVLTGSRSKDRAKVDAPPVVADRIQLVQQLIEIHSSRELGPRSASFFLGAAAGITVLVTGYTHPGGFRPGTPECDAFRAGFESGQRVVTGYWNARTFVSVNGMPASPTSYPPEAP